MQSQDYKKLLLVFLLMSLGYSAKAQLSDLHYLPPLRQGANNQAVQKQAVYISTPVQTPFTVFAYRGTNTTPIASFPNLSNTNPAIYTLPNGDNNISLVTTNNTGRVLTNAGLRFESDNGQKFYINYRGNSKDQAASLTCKGRVAMGTHFKWGGIPNHAEHISISSTLGIMATEDNTTITLSGYHPDTEFRLGSNPAGITSNTHTIILNKNESFVYEAYQGTQNKPAQVDGWLGASIVANQNIVISNGALNFGVVTNNEVRDAGIDQPVPENKIGKEYIFVRGNGNSTGRTEFPIMIATEDNTAIYINGATTPIATINNGEYFKVPSWYYSSSTVGANMLVQTSKNTYAYQCLAGGAGEWTPGLNFVAPVNCLLPDVMDNIPDITSIADIDIMGGVTIIASTSTLDSNIIVTDSGGIVNMPAPAAVVGSDDWKTFYIPNLSGNVSVQSTGPMAVGFFGYNGARGVAGYFSGFDTAPDVTLAIRGGEGCFVGSELFESTGNFDAYQWFLDGEMMPGENGPTLVGTIAGDYFLRGTKGRCTYDSKPIKAYYCDPDVVLTKTVDKPEVLEGDTATFTIKVQNLGDGPVTNLQITDNIPAGLTLESFHTITGTWNGSIWNIGTLQSGATAFLELAVRADEVLINPLERIINTATNSQDQIDSNKTLDTPSAQIIVYNDYDYDGVIDILDLDDDQDGVYDTDECFALISTNATINNNITSSLNTTGTALLPLDPDGTATLPNGGVRINTTFGNGEAWSIYTPPITTGNIIVDGQEVTFNTQYLNIEGAIDRSVTIDFGISANNLSNTSDKKHAYYIGIAGLGQEGGSLAINSSDILEIMGFIDVFTSGAYSVFNGIVNPMKGLTGTTIETAEPYVEIQGYTFYRIPEHLASISLEYIMQSGYDPSGISVGVLTENFCDTDMDGIPNHIDLYSENDDCSDANRFYKNENADGGDGGTYGSGVPVVDPTTGLVTNASYVQPSIPEILLENTTENLGGIDINGEDIALGETFEYVLRFQNTGAENAINYTIRNILPSNTILNTIDVTNAPLTTYTHAAGSNTLTFAIPDNLVEIGKPQYSIRIQVSLSTDCSNFLDACTAFIENSAFSTYQGETTGITYTDENDANNITGCPVIEQVARNTIYNDFSSCNVPRLMQLCGESILLQAGLGFNVYNWYLDANKNGVVDPTENTPLNDGNPDNDMSTLEITGVGDYIVEKITNNSCSDMLEHIRVEPFGTNNTNPIISYFNKVNSDANPKNDIQGEIVSCSIDGDLLTKIFLCGAADEATIPLDITDAQSISWQKLNETSCNDTGEDCANKNGTCQWTSVATQDNFTVSESGEYRVVITYQNGCFSRFYFSVFKNNLSPTFTTQDMLCSNPGIIRINNIGNGYGYQLIDASTYNVLVPFSANNGPSFNINTLGSYIVQITQLDPLTGTPITGSCIFETEAIGIEERSFTVDISTTPANCASLGTINVHALNALPNYNFELRLDDGTAGGQGTLVSNQPALTSNTYTFESVNPGNYILNTNTQDGCIDSQQITVLENEALTLTSVTYQNISCYAGIVNLTPAGGVPNSDYRLAIWSVNGVNLYTTPEQIPADAFQNSTTFVFEEGSASGRYDFIVLDDSGCSAISNQIEVQDLGELTVTASNATIVCADSASGILTVTATGGTAPYSYSLDNGDNYQAENTFVNLAAGFYTITVKDASSNGNDSCIATLVYEITQPFPLKASATVLEDVSCHTDGALVKILNPTGGQTPYEYSFDGGVSFTLIDTQRLLSGTYTLQLRDALGCLLSMDVTVPSPAPEPNFVTSVNYNCLGQGNISITPDNPTDFYYRYSLNGNTPITTGTFTNIPSGTHLVDVSYGSAANPIERNLFFEDFGAGPTTQIAEIGPGYCFEPQNGSETSCNYGPAGILVNAEYTVTSAVTNPTPSWRSPTDHTGIANGRFLAIDISTIAGEKGVLWARRDLEVLPNRDIDVSFWAYNLMQTSGNGNNPEVRIELVDTAGNVLGSIDTFPIQKNTNSSDWQFRNGILNPGPNTTVDIVLRSNLDSDFGNDLVLDDIKATQQPAICEQTASIVVVVEDNQAFNASILNAINPSCAGGSDGALRFEVSNFDPTTGFEYSIDGGLNWLGETVSPVTTPTSFSAGNQTILVRRTNNTACLVSMSATLTDPTTIIPSLIQTFPYTCYTIGGILEASATGGNPAYQYQLENTAGAIIRPYQTSTQFLDITEGNYRVRVVDQNNCSALSTNAVTIPLPTPITFMATPTACYSGTNDGTITVNVTSGNGNYEYRIDGQPWVSPTPSTNSYTFTGLSQGSHSIEVRDAYMCPVSTNSQTVIINAPLIVDTVVTPLSACGDGRIEINATGGTGTLVYAIVPANTNPSGLYTISNSLVITETMAMLNPNGFDVYVQDNNGTPGLCDYLEEDIVLLPATPLSITTSVTNPLCYNGLGSISVNSLGGTAPYTYTLTDISPGDLIDYSRSDISIFANTHTFYGIGSGDYIVSVTDENSCLVTSTTITITNAIEITADLSPLLPSDCTSTLESDYGFEFINITTPSVPMSNIEYSNDGGANWQSSTELRGTVANPTFPGTAVFPSIRVEVAPGIYCQKDFDRHTIQFPLDDLDIATFPQIVDCNDLQVTVQGSEGVNTTGYRYTYTDDPANFANTTPVWTASIPSGTPYTFANINPTTPALPGLPLLVPGRTYTFYVQDGAGCVRQNQQNINEIPTINLPIEIAPTVTPSCAGSATGSITFSINPITNYPRMHWEVYKVGTLLPVETSGGPVDFTTDITITIALDEGDYYIDITQLELDDVTERCRGASENTYVPELAPITASAVGIRDISCNLPGLISINNIMGGGGQPYTYNLTGPVGFTQITGSTDNPVQVPANSPAGNYTVTVIDRYGCSLELPSVSVALAPNPTITNITQDNCSAPIGLNVLGASLAGNLHYAITPASSATPTNFLDNAGIFNNVTPGVYDVYVRDGNGCIGIQTSFEVYPVLSASASLGKLIDCTPSSDAVININIASGSGIYEYQITNTAGAPNVLQTATPGSTFSYQTALPGEYTITVYDMNPTNSSICQREFTLQVPPRISPIIDPNIIVKPVSCEGANDGSITIAASSIGAAPYTFRIVSMDGNPENIVPTSSTSNSATFTNLAPTTTAAGYQIRVQGDVTLNNCFVDSGAIILTSPDVISLDTPSVVEFGCTTGNTTSHASITLNNSTGGSGTFVRYEFWIAGDNPDTATVETMYPVQSGTQTTYIETNPNGGTYTVYAYDDKGCAGTITASIAPYDVLNTPVIQIDNPISCVNSGENIRIDATSSITSFASNPGNYEFRQFPSSSYQTSNQFVNLAPGNYTFGVKNIATQCEILVTHTVFEPNTFDVEVLKLSDTACYGDTGSITLTITDPGYMGTFTYQLFNTNGTTTDRSDDTAIGAPQTVWSTGTTGSIDVPAGNYIVEVLQVDLPNCPQLRSFTINSPNNPISIAPINTIDVSCTNNQGSALIRPIGGLAPYSITITNTSTNTSASSTDVNAHLFQNLSAGQYNIVVTDALGCSIIFSNYFELLLPDAIHGSITATSLQCHGDVNASIAINLSPRNISSTYRYILRSYQDATTNTLLQSSASQTSNNFSNLTAGFYTIQVADDTNCSFESPLLEIVNPLKVQAQLVTDQSLSCSENAIISLHATGGTGPYEWSTDGITFNAMNNGTHHTFMNIAPGVHSYIIRDNNSCGEVSSNVVDIQPIEELTLNIDRDAAFINCNGENSALLVAQASGGLGNYEFGLFADESLQNQLVGYQNTGLFTNLTYGQYYIHVQSRDCEISSQLIEITEPPILTTEPFVTNIQCLDDDNGEINIVTTGGTGTYQYAISPNLNQFNNASSFSNLPPGDYNIIVQDSNGCFDYFELTIEEPSLVEARFVTTPETCVGNEDGSISITVSGGTPPYSTALNSNQNEDFVANRTRIDNLAGGIHTIFIKDANDCVSSNSVRIENGANLNAKVEIVYECTESTPVSTAGVVLEDTSELDNILFALDADDTNDLNQETVFRNITPGNHTVTIAHANGCINTVAFSIPEFTPLELRLTQNTFNRIDAIATGGTGSYTYYFDGENNARKDTYFVDRTDTFWVRVVDENGCEATASIFIEFIDIEIPNFFTPDNDGNRDCWKPKYIEQFPNIEIIVFDRKGRELFQIPYDSEGWCGQYQNNNLPSGDYWYTIKLNRRDDDPKYTGQFTLYR